KCSDQKVSNKTIYKTFARTLPPSSKVSKSVISLLKHFSWDKVVLVVSENHWDKQVEEALLIRAEEESIQITNTFYIPGFYISGSHNENIKQIIHESYKITRMVVTRRFISQLTLCGFFKFFSTYSAVYIILADIDALVDFARYMGKQELLDDGKYVIICVEDKEVYDPAKSQQYLKK
ncbi:guanylate cyclase 32E-like, partial [Limulus polyphemus]|uniref:Guanylate cyclase 32E-like n=1 Tax=Limulus polyphemus TaxID=6850 RepID=A0ABM1C1F2_LIMPO